MGLHVTYFILIMVGVVSGALVEMPSNTAVKLGKQLRLNCSSDVTNSTSFSWSVGPTHLYGCLPDDGTNQIPPPYYFESKDNGCDLIVNATTYDQAGVFTCDTGVPGEKASAAVAVLGVDSPSVSQVGGNHWTPGLEATVHCSIEYASPMTASLVWSMNYDIDVINKTTSALPGIPSIPSQLNSTITITHDVLGSFTIGCGPEFRPVDINQADLDKTNVTYGFSTTFVNFDPYAGMNGSAKGSSVSAFLFGIVGFFTLKSM